MKHYLKELVSQRLYSSSGAVIAFVDVGNDTGILKTDNEYLINELDMAIARSIGGVVPITEERFVEMEKKSSGLESPLNSLKDRFSLSQATLGAGLRSHVENVAETGELGRSSGLTNTRPPQGFDTPRETPPPLKVEESFSKPVTRRAYRKRGAVP